MRMEDATQRRGPDNILYFDGVVRDMHDQPDVGRLRQAQQV